MQAQKAENQDTVTKVPEHLQSPSEVPLSKVLDP